MRTKTVELENVLNKKTKNLRPYQLFIKTRNVDSRPCSTVTNPAIFGASRDQLNKPLVYYVKIKLYKYSIKSRLLKQKMESGVSDSIVMTNVCVLFAVCF